MYSDSQPLAVRYPSGLLFEHENWLGTERARTDYTGAVTLSIADLPWGDGHTPSGDNGDQHDFAQMDRDLEDGTELAQFRQYSTLIGRWLSPDPYLGSYDFTNPQSFDRYAYALNNPAAFIDPTGLDDSCIEYYDPSLGRDVSICYAGDGFDGHPSCTPVVDPQGMYLGCSGGNGTAGGGGNQGSGGANGGGTAGGPANPKSPLTCLGAALNEGRGVALALDAVGDIATAIAVTNPASTTAIVVGAAAGALGSLNAVQHFSLSSYGMSFATQTIGATSVLTHALETSSFIQAGTSFAKGLTQAGILGAVVSTVADAGAAISAYSACRNPQS